MVLRIHRRSRSSRRAIVGIGFSEFRVFLGPRVFVEGFAEKSGSCSQLCHFVLSILNLGPLQNVEF